MNKRKWQFILCFLCYSFIAFSTTYYVNVSRPDDSGNGLSWATAKKTILAASLLPNVVGDQIFVARGTYAEGLIGIVNGVSVYGGFAGTESTFAERNYILNRTIIHSAGIAVEGRLDGFDLTGSGQYIISNTLTTAEINHCRFYGNGAGSVAGLPCIDFRGKLVNSLIYGNSSGGWGIALRPGAIVDSCTIVNNNNYPITIEAAVTINNTIVSGNTGDIIVLETPLVNYSMFDQAIVAVGTGNIVGLPPVFVNPLLDGNADYRLASGSPGIGVGSMNSLPTDYYGLPRSYTNAQIDIGACEYNAPPSVTLSSSSPVNLLHTTTHFTVEGTCSDPEGSVLAINVSSGTTNIGQYYDSGANWSTSFPIYPAPFVVNVTALDEGYALGIASETFTVQAVIPDCSLITPAASPTIIPADQSSMDFYVQANDDNAISEIQYRFGSDGAWSSSSDYANELWHFLLENIPEGTYTVQIKSVDADGYESSVIETQIIRKRDHLYVDASSSAVAPDGLSWSTAFPTISEALNHMEYVEGLWVADGTYQESATVVIGESISLYGGFAGSETSLSERSIVGNQTIVDGQNLFQCIDNSGVLDGIYVRNGTNYLSDTGGGVYNKASGTVRNCFVYNNFCTGTFGGGGIRNYGTVEYCEVYDNTTESRGAGVSNYGLLRFSKIYNNSTTSTSSAFGGGVYHDGSSFHDCEIYGNSVDWSGGGVYAKKSFSNVKVYDNHAQFGGGVNMESTSNMDNSLVYNNTASMFGGGCRITGSSIVNCTLYNNASDGGGVYGRGTLINTIVWKSSGEDFFEYNGSITTRGCCYFSPDFDGGDASDVISPPLFVNVSGAAETWDLSLQNQSPCIDRGVEDPLVPALDFNGQARPGADNLICIGAIESPDDYTPGDIVSPAQVRLYVDEDGDNTDGSSWEHAFTDLQAALDFAVDIEFATIEIWVGLQSYTISKTLEISSIVSLYGGFVGNETSKDERDLDNYKTIIDGGGLYRCAKNSGLVNGFQFTNGYMFQDGTGENVYFDLFYSGSGVFNMGIMEFCEVCNCVSEGTQFAGALTNQGSLTDSLIYGNTSENHIAGVYNDINVSFERCRIYDNRCDNGIGGLYNSGKVVNSLIFSNQSSSGASAVYSIGELRFCTIAGNEVNGAAGLLSYGRVYNSIVWNHSLNMSNNGTVMGCCYPEATQGIDYCTNSDPLFVQDSGDFATWDLSLQFDSPCIDAAHSGYSSTVDLCNHSRPNGNGYDIGAYEINQPPILQITYPSSDSSVSFNETKAVFNGTASDPDGSYLTIEYRNNSGEWLSTTSYYNTSNGTWSFMIDLIVGENVIEVRARDSGGGYSVPSGYTITRSDNQAPTLTIETPSQSSDTVPYIRTSYGFYGTASDSDGSISSVQYRNNEGDWMTASDKYNWLFYVELVVGENHVDVRALDDQMKSSEVHTVVLTRTEQLTAAFYSNIGSIEQGASVQFTDTSSGTVSDWAWDFDNDGTIDSQEQNPSWVYSNPGLYSVSLKASNLNEQQTSTIVDYISVYPSDAQSYDSQIISDTIPDYMIQGNSYNVEIKLKNTGQETWLDSQRIFLGAVGDSDPLATSRFLRVDIGRDIRYGETVTFDIEMKPVDAGVHTTDWQMIYEGNFWFGEVLSLEVEVERKTAVSNEIWIIYQ